MKHFERRRARVVFHKAQPIATWAGLLGSPLMYATEHTNGARAVSNGRSIRPSLVANADGFVLVSQSTRADHSPTCIELGSCVDELFARQITLDGTEGSPQQLTNRAQPLPYVPKPDKWRQHCATQLAPK